MKWTTDSGLPADTSHLADVLRRATWYENLDKPTGFAPIDYKSHLEVDDVFHRYELDESQYSANSLWRVQLAGNGAYLLTRFGGTGTVFANRDWFCRDEGKWGYAKVGRFTGGQSVYAENLESWIAEYSGV